MRTIMTTLAVLWASAALAQSPIQLTPAAPKGALKHVVEDATTQRFADDAAVAGPSLETGDVVEVMMEEGDRVRVKKGSAYGWVDADVLSDTPPAEEATPEAAPE